MSNLSEDFIVRQIKLVLTIYRFELHEHTSESLINKWSNLYPLEWIRLAVLEALYLGRYKAESVEQILSLWLRRQSVTFRVTKEFEKLICENLILENPPVIKTTVAEEKIKVPAIDNYLPQEELSPFYFKLRQVVEEE